MKWEDFPQDMKNDEVFFYYNIIKKKRLYFFLKRVSDVFFSVILFILFLPIILIISLLIKIDSSGPIFFKQERITYYKKKFKIFKFRTMIENAEKKGSSITIKNDPRITKLGKLLRKFHFDEIPQIFNIMTGDMSFVGTRPEIEKYVVNYTNEMKATFLMPAGLTSFASIKFRNESDFLEKKKREDDVYINEILPKKMKYNLLYLKKFSFLLDVEILFKTFFTFFY
ncbi:MAG: sugar transferase [Oscillospiraceae bacterium]|jgi:lipopolysaccharide/colanic/teichoic acid biosynthesis glycosyltransferase|nr:sugar transferase [Oscillospiraceae bacterium]